MTLPENRPFRFGVNLVTPAPRREWAEKSRKVEALGFDVLGVPDHLGAPAPFPALVAAAEATERIRVTTFVLNAAFHNPVLLAREAATADLLTEGRLEVGLAAGSIREGTGSDGVPFPSAGERVSQLERTVKELRGLMVNPDHAPQPVQPGGPPLLVAGNGDRVLRLAAEHADIIGFTGIFLGRGEFPQLASPEELGERVALVREQLGARIAEVELNLLVQQVIVTDDPRGTAEEWARHPLAHFTPEQLLATPAWLIGSQREIADRLTEYRERFGLSYVVVLEPWLEAFAPVVEMLK
ncbi:MULTISPECIES: TIGR03621 family F420-dependent LLM class oxidoreductase [unclassified Streptomyces]|uniref:TIGR03621 family F420-dependent LLM class oxidoreductase n=1 Tax=Streptomyces sp. NPDC005955 TaxID=3364738 RepID=UPI003695A245